jgi:hypothetical protein
MMKANTNRWHFSGRSNGRVLTYLVTVPLVERLSLEPRTSQFPLVTRLLEVSQEVRKGRAEIHEA